MTARLRPIVIATAAIGLAVALVVGLLIGAGLGRSAASAGPSTNSVDAGFARDMQVHHAQAVQLSTIVREGTDDPDVSRLALDIALTQQHQAGQMYAWLEQWGLPQRSSVPVMAWMGGHEHASADHDAADRADLMPGMATRAELTALEQSIGVTAERRFLALMIDHHVAGVEMAAYAAEHATHEPVRHLATAMVRAQESEIDLLTRLLEERGGPLG